MIHTRRLTVILLLIASMGWAVAPHAMLAPQPAPRHVEWEYYEAGGMILVRTDSTQAFVRLPEGTLIAYPRWVEGTVPATARTQA